jgi:prephenate dehydrogenase
VDLAILGLGLIGGSLALAARKRGMARHVVAIDVADVLLLPAARAAADRLVDVCDAAEVRSAFAAADVVIMATPVATIQATLETCLEVARVVTDCGSTKRTILETAARSPRRGRFVPGHPMAGLPQGGIQRATPDLFEGRPWLVCPEASDEDAVALVEELIVGVGAEPRRLGAEEHDRAVALTSHVPQLLASALAVLADGRGARAAAGPAFERMTVVAGGGEVMWRDILATNADQIAGVLSALGSELESIAQGLRASPTDLGPALQLLERARAVRGRSPAE